MRAWEQKGRERVRERERDGKGGRKNTNKAQGDRQPGSKVSQARIGI